MERKLFQQFKEWLPEMMDLIGELVCIETGTGCKEGIEETYKIIEPYLNDLGLRCAYRPTPAGPILIAEHKKPRYLFMGHMDTVFPLGTIKTNPFRIEGNRAYGPGVIDMKSGLVSMVYVLKALSLVSDKHQEVLVIINPDEEISSPYSRPIIEEGAKRVEAAFVFEPTKKKEWITTKRKGVGSLKLFIKGRASHAGSSPEEGLSANRELARRILEIEELTDLNRGVTVNTGRMGGGTARNTIPEDAWAHIDLRFWNEEEGLELVESIHRICKKGIANGYKVQIEGGITRPPLKRSKKGEDLFSILMKSASSLGVQLKEIEAGGVSDANFISAANTPVLDSLGPVGDRAHSLDEYLEIETIPLKAAMVTDALLKR